MKIKNYVLSLLAVLALGVSGAFAASESALVDGNVTNAQLGTVHTSSGTGRAGSTRRISVDDNGNAFVMGGFVEVVKTTGTGIAGSFVFGGSSNTFYVSLASWTGNVGCRGMGDNCNVVRRASLSNPVYLDRIRVGSVVGGGVFTGANSGKTQLRIWDSQGSTATPAVPEIFNMPVSSATTFEIKYWCSSGTVMMIDSPADIELQFGRQTR